MGRTIGQRRKRESADNSGCREAQEWGMWRVLGEESLVRFYEEKGGAESCS